MSDLVDMADMRLQRQIGRLDDRRVFELLCDLGARFLIRTEIDALVARYAALDAEVVGAIGGDRPAPTPLHLVPR